MRPRTTRICSKSVLRALKLAEHRLLCRLQQLLSGGFDARRPKARPKLESHQCIVTVQQQYGCLSPPRAPCGPTPEWQRPTNASQSAALRCATVKNARCGSALRADPVLGRARSPRPSPRSAGTSASARWRYPVHLSNYRGASPPLLNAPNSLVHLRTGLADGRFSFLEGKIARA